MSPYTYFFILSCPCRIRVVSISVLQSLPYTAHVQAIEDLLYDRDKTLKLLKDHLQLAQERMKYFADKERTERHFEVGDLVLLKLQPYRQLLVRSTMPQKLSARYYGPYRVVTKISKVAYMLRLPQLCGSTTCFTSSS